MYDLLKPPESKTFQKPTVRSPHQQHKIEAQLIKEGQAVMHKKQRLVHMELMALLKENVQQFDMEPFTTGLPDLIASIKTWIQQLTEEATLLKLDKKMKETYIDQVPCDIPHVKDFPQDVFHHIKLLPGMPISMAYAYACPSKYRAGWKNPN